VSIELSSAERDRYARHLVLLEIGEEGQRKLKNARVVVVGLGGLGSPAALYLAAAGVGTLGLVDDEVVELSNLQRQVIHFSSSQGMPKVRSAEARLREVNPHVQVEGMQVRLRAVNALDLLKKYDVVIDASDNLETRYLINDACALLGLPDVYGSVVGFEGHVSVFDARKGPCYRCLYPRPPEPGSIRTCSEAGVLGVLPGMVGTLQAAEALKLVLGVGESLIGRVVLVDALGARFDEMRLQKDQECPLCGTRPSIRALIDYEAFCSHKGGTTNLMGSVFSEISVQHLKQRLEKGESILLLDVREPYEYRVANLSGHLIPLGQLADRAEELDRSREIVVYCHHGSRSAFAVQFLKNQGFERVLNLTGGIDAWSREVDPSLPRY